jgi:hypothetical protein
MGRTERGPEPIGSGAESYGESANADAARTVGHARLSAAISSGLVRGDEPSRKTAWRHRPVTTGQIIAAAIGSVSVIAILLGLLPFIYALFIPEPFHYDAFPFRVCGKGTVDIENCLPNDHAHAFMPRDVVPFIVNRCVDDRFVTGVVLPYVVARNLHNVNSGVTIILDSLSTAAPVGGCSSSLTTAHSLPDAVVPGQYYLEGVATVYGRFRTVNAYFRTENFEVVSSD